MWLVGMGGDSRMCFGISKSFATLQYLVAGAYYINSDILVVYAESLSMPPCALHPAHPFPLPCRCQAAVSSLTALNSSEANWILGLSYVNIVQTLCLIWSELALSYRLRCCWSFLLSIVTRVAVFKPWRILVQICDVVFVDYQMKIKTCVSACCPTSYLSLTAVLILSCCAKWRCYSKVCWMATVLLL